MRIAKATVTKQCVIHWKAGKNRLPGVTWSELPWTEIKKLVDSGALSLEEIQYSEERQEQLDRYSESLAQEMVNPLIQVPPGDYESWIRFWEQGLGANFKSGIFMAPGGLQEDHQVPGEWSWEMWCILNARTNDGKWKQLSDEEIAKLPKRHLLHGSRGGQKTLGLAGLAFAANWFIPGYSWTHSATQKHQSEAMLEYQRDIWCNSPLFAHGIRKKTNTKINFANESTLVLITASMDGFNSDHTLTFSCDEVETLPWSVLKEGLRIPQKETGRPLPSLSILASTQKEPGRTMTLLIKKARQGEYRYHKWNCMDIGEQCPDWRTKSLPKNVRCADYPMITGQITRLESRQLLGGEEQALLERLREKRDALQDNCKLIGYCKGLLKKGRGHYAIDEILQALDDDKDQFEAQMMCIRASPTNAVYPRFNEENLKKDAIWRPNKTVFAAGDYGHAADPCACVIGLVNGPDVDVFYCMQENDWDSRMQADFYWGLHNRYKVSEWAIGADATELIKFMRAYGMKVTAIKRDVSRGIDKVKARICNARNERTLFFNPAKCSDLIDDLSNYKKNPNTNRPIQKDDHLPDALRYLLEIIDTNRRKNPGKFESEAGIGRSRG